MENTNPMMFNNPGDSKLTFDPLVRSHLALERVTFSPSQNGHKRIAKMIMMFMFIEVLHKKSLLNPVVMPVQQFTVATLLLFALKTP